MEAESQFSSDERAALHSLAEMFQDKDSRDELRRLVHDGTTLREIILAYKTNRRVISTLWFLQAALWLRLRGLIFGRSRRASFTPPCVSWLISDGNDCADQGQERTKPNTQQQFVAR